MSSAAVERFKNFDFDNDDRWKEYLNALTFPPGRDDLILKYKAKWYKREIEPEFNIDDVITAKPSASKATPSTAPSPPPPSTQQNQTATGSSTPTASTAQPGFIDVALLTMHVYLLMCCLMALQPFNPFLAMKGLARCNKVSLPLHMIRLYRKVGSPTAGAAGGMSTWFKNVSRTTESFHIFLISMATSNPAAWVGILPVAILTIYHISAALNSMFGKTAFWQRVGAAKVHSYLAVHQQNALQAIAILEIGTFFSVLLSVPKKGPLGLFACYAFLAQLRMRFWSPESRVYHVNGWRRLGETVQPVVSKIGFAQKIVERGERFFESGRPIVKKEA